MKINSCGQVGRTEQELTHMVRANPSCNLVGAVCINPQQYNHSVKELYSDLTPLVQWQECDSAEQWHQQLQNQWRMPMEWQQIDIASLLLDRCASQAELQRMGEELLLFQELDLMDLLRYLHYMVHVFESNDIVMGVGRGSSVASFALYKLGVHCVDSLYYDLDIREFLK